MIFMRSKMRRGIECALLFRHGSIDAEFVTIVL